MSVKCSYCNRGFTKKSKNTHAIICKNNVCLLWFHHINSQGKHCSQEWIREQHHLKFNPAVSPSSQLDNIVSEIKCECGCNYIGLQTKNFETIEAASGIHNYKNALNKYLNGFISETTYQLIIPPVLKDFMNMNKLLFHSKFYMVNLTVDELIPHIRGGFHGNQVVGLSYGQINDLSIHILRPLAVLVRMFQGQFWEKEKEIREVVETKLRL